MSRSTIDFGIDLGTTNSAISVLDGVEPKIIKNTDDQDTTPSAVFINKQGVLRVGSRAKSAMVGERSHRDAYTEFKRQMGTPHLYEFASSGRRMKPEELSAEVLKELRASVEARSGEIIQAAVITVPATFELHQCDSTRRAAELAGLAGSPLVQEPVAAALAYGFQADTEKAYWMVYDFRGGTFDAALLKAEEGMINVVHHGGDNFLGGSDIDWAIIEEIIIPQLAGNYDLPGFARGSDRWGAMLVRIKHAVEAAKLELSTKEVTSLGGAVAFEDDSGETIECDEIMLSRNDLIRVAEPLISRSVEISRRVLTEKGLGVQAVERVLLVGGPTKAPYFREMLSAGLGMPIDFSQDPLTVVSLGAAVFASTQKIDAKLQRKAKVGEFQIEIASSYKPAGHDPEPLIAGKVTSPEGCSVDGLTIEFVNRDTKWRSGQVPLKAEGAFMANLLAERGSRNIFHIELMDSQGTAQKAIPEEISYTIGAVVEEQPLLKSIGLGKANNTVDWFFKSGVGLPQKKHWPHAHQTTVALKIGEPGAIRIPIVEGENEHADRNRPVGELVIDSTMVQRDLPSGSKFEITLRIDESRCITLTAFFPVLDEEFMEKLLIEKSSADAGAISEGIEEAMQRVQHLKEKAGEVGDDEALEEIEELEHDKDRDEVVRAAKGDPGAAEKAQARLLELQNKLDAAEEKLNSPSQVNFVKSSSQSLPLGTRLEEFLIEKMLGSGGCGITYLARDTRLERQVVVKENLPVQLCYRDTHSLTVAPRHTVGEDAENFAWSLENFSKEAVMLASLEHPGIVRVLRSFEALGTAYFVMPFVEGRSLDELLKERGGRPFAEEELRGLLGKVLDALGYLHDRGIYHRDIKPGNLLITEEGAPMLIGFGSARQRLSERSMTVVESAGYTPFEQLESRENVGPWSDLYALGATMVKVMTGEAPPKANDRIRKDSYVPLTERAELSGIYRSGLLSAVDQALRVEEGERWLDARDWKGFISA